MTPQVLLLLLTAPALACMGAVVDGPWFVLVRLAVGSSLGLFVVAQFWVVAHFSSEACGPAAGEQCRTRGALEHTQSNMGKAVVLLLVTDAGGLALESWGSSTTCPVSSHPLPRATCQFAMCHVPICHVPRAPRWATLVAGGLAQATSSVRSGPEGLHVLR